LIRTVFDWFNKFRNASAERNSSAEPGPSLIPSGQRVYAVGDIHGRADLLQQLHQLILDDSAAFNGAKTVVYLGDYIDRGDWSREVIELLLTQPLPGFANIYLRGNHEQAMLDFIEHPVEAANWLGFGGRETLSSYGIILAHIPTQAELPELAQQLSRELPQTHKVFLDDSTGCWQCGGYYFVHAGIRPGVALDKQTAHDQMWIREDFLTSSKDHGAIVVHGHSIFEKPEILANRIGIDTGAYTSGVLTCVVLEGNEQRLLQTQ